MRSCRDADEYPLSNASLRMSRWASVCSAMKRGSGTSSRCAHSVSFLRLTRISARARTSGSCFPLLQTGLVEPQEDAFAEHLDRRIHGLAPLIRTEICLDELGLGAVAPESQQRAHLAHTVHLPERRRVGR